jgi:hypothetical protein
VGTRDSTKRSVVKRGTLTIHRSTLQPSLAPVQMRYTAVKNAYTLVSSSRSHNSTLGNCYSAGRVSHDMHSAFAVSLFPSGYTHLFMETWLAYCR